MEELNNNTDNQQISKLLEPNEKVKEKRDFISCITSVGGPMYSSNYEEEFINGLSLTLRSVRDIFSTETEFHILINCSERTILLNEVDKLLLVLMNGPAACQYRSTELCFKISAYFYNFMLNFIFKQNIEQASVRYDATSYIEQSKYLLNNLFYDMIVDKSFLFEALSVSMLAKDIKYDLENIIKSNLPDVQHDDLYLRILCLFFFFIKEM